ncbi:hypothetical protein L1887_51721 [Cichorium endivia]|nr:hypothetical protein L1887_51721 [Cichorium endivia]
MELCPVREYSGTTQPLDVAVCPDVERERPSAIDFCLPPFSYAHAIASSTENTTDHNLELTHQIYIPHKRRKQAARSRGDSELALGADELELLAHAQVDHHVLASAGHGERYKSHHEQGGEDALDAFAGAALGEAHASEQMHRLAHHLLEHDTGVRLEQRTRAAGEQVRLRNRHVELLEDDALRPGLQRLHLARHVADFVAHHRLLDQHLAEHLSSSCVRNRILHTHPSVAQGCVGDRHALVIEVKEDQLEAFSFLADEVLDGDLDVVELDDGRARSSAGKHLHLFGGDAGSTRDHKQRNAARLARLAGRANGSGEPVRVDSIGDPLLAAVNEVELLSILLDERRLGAEVGDVATGKGLGDGKADSLPAGKDLGKPTCLLLVAGKVHDGPGAIREAANQAHQYGAGAAVEFVPDDVVVDVVPFLHLDAGREADTSSLGDLGDLGVDVHARGESKEHAVLGSALVRFVIIDDAGFLVLGTHLDQDLVAPHPAPFAQLDMRGRGEDRGRQSLDPWRLGKWNGGLGELGGTGHDCKVRLGGGRKQGFGMPRPCGETPQTLCFGVATLRDSTDPRECLATCTLKGGTNSHARLDGCSRNASRRLTTEADGPVEKIQILTHQSSFALTTIAKKFSEDGSSFAPHDPNVY